MDLIRQHGLVARAKDIIAGRIQPPPLVAPPWVVEFFRKDLADRDPPPTPQAMRMLLDSASLEAQYSGVPIACFTTPAGYEVVLAAGEDELRALLQGVTGEERSKFVIDTFGIYF